MTDDEKTLKLLLKKWELLWNHYKFQDEMMEKRRNLLWIIQSFIFAAWYYCYIKATEPYYLEFTYLFKLLSSYIIPIFGLVINIIMFYVLKRHGISVLINEYALRDVEYQWNLLSKTVKFDRFIIDKKILYFGICHEWHYGEDDYIKENKFIKWSSQRRLLNKFVPIMFLFIWLILLLHRWIYYYFSSVLLLIL